VQTLRAPENSREDIFGFHLAAFDITEFPPFFFDPVECNIMTDVHFWADMTATAFK
jgi:hypothetical protein